jgi:hypothetical protein
MQIPHAEDQSVLTRRHVGEAQGLLGWVLQIRVERHDSVEPGAGQGSKTGHQSCTLSKIRYVSEYLSARSDRPISRPIRGTVVNDVYRNSLSALGFAQSRNHLTNGGCSLVRGN